MVLTYYEPGKEPRVEINWSTFPAGRSLDALVAERVMGCKVIRPNGDRLLTLCGCPLGQHGTRLSSEGPLGVPPYSTEIASAWEVVLEMRRRGMPLEVHAHDDADEWCVQFMADGWTEATCSGTFEHAVCRAALEALAWTARKP